VARKTAQDRSDQIKTALEEAAALRAAAQAKLDEYGKKLAAADAEIAAMVEGMRKDAEAEKARVIAAADAQAIAMKKDADERIAAEIDRARASLAREVSRAATSAAEKLVRERATSADHGKLIDAFIADLGAEASRANKEVR
jgi:F-type H+-transporting ATPase subunit b